MWGEQAGIVRRLRFWTIYLLVAMFASLALLEVAVRLLGLAPPLPQQYSSNVADPFLPWKPRPLSVVEGRSDEYQVRYEHNSAGFRDVEHSLKKPAGTFRILGLGDSFTYGVGARYEETYLYRLEQMLNERPQGHQAIEVIKAGVPRYWPEPERLMLEHYGLSYAPDLILVAFLPNDVIDTHVGLNGVTVNRGFLVRPNLGPLADSGVWLYLHSRLFRTLVVRHLAATHTDETTGSSATPDGDEEDWRTIEAEYAKMAQLARRAGASFAVVYIPQKGPWPPSARDDPRQRLSRWCAAHQVPFIDTLPALEGAAERAPLYYARDGHCTPAGYDIIARCLYSALLQSPRGLVPH